MPQRTYTHIQHIIHKSSSILLIPHEYPDGDACGAVSGLADFLYSKKKKVTIFCATPAPKNLLFLPHIHEMTSDERIWDTQYDTIILCDSSDITRTGTAHLLQKQKNATRIVIDHHAGNTHFGDINIVQTDCSSTTEILYLFFTHIKHTITHNIATALLTGLFTDTGIFSNSGTSPSALSIGSTLVRKGADLATIRKNIIQDKHLHTLKLWGLSLSRLTHDTELDIVHTYLSLTDMLVTGTDEENAQGIANILNSIQEGKIRIFFRENTNHTVKVSMRTTYDTVDVSQIAREFGGGGHKKAAGFTLSSSIEHAYTHMLPVLKKYLKPV